VELPLAADPVHVQVDGPGVPPTTGWRYDRPTGVLRVTVRMADGTITVEGDVR
jgi:hypothetical protein